MATKSIKGADKGLRVLVIHSPGKRPNEASLRELLRDAGCTVSEIVFATPADITAGNVDPADFDRVITILDDELGEDTELDGAMVAVAGCGQGVTGIWPAGASSKGMHPAVERYGKSQVPWDPTALSKALQADKPEPFQSTAGGPAASHTITPNKC